MPPPVQPTDDQLDVVQHPTLGTLKFPKEMPPDQRNSMIQSMELEDPATMQAHAQSEASGAITKLGMGMHYAGGAPNPEERSYSAPNELTGTGETSEEGAQDAGETALTGATMMIPGPGAGGRLATQVVKGGLYGAGVGALGHAGNRIIHGELPDLEGTAKAAGTGGLFGAILNPISNVGGVRAGLRSVPFLRRYLPEAEDAAEYEGFKPSAGVKRSMGPTSRRPYDPLRELGSSSKPLGPIPGVPTPEDDTSYLDTDNSLLNDPGNTGNEGSAARWTNQRAYDLARKGSRQGIMTLGRRGIEPPPNSRYIMGDPDYERVVRNPSEVTTSAPENTPVRNMARVPKGSRRRIVIAEK